MNKKYLALAISSPALFVGSMAHAALDEAVTDGITAAQTDLVELYTTLMGAGIVIFVARVLYRKFFIR